MRHMTRKNPRLIRTHFCPNLATGLARSGGWCIVGDIVTLATTMFINISSKRAGGRKFKNE